MADLWGACPKCHAQEWTVEYGREHQWSIHQVCAVCGEFGDDLAAWIAEEEIDEESGR
jgi:hypothetical protein